MILKQSCPDSSYLCIRYGGDEFLMLGTYSEECSADILKRRIVDGVELYNTRHELPVRLSMSLGTVVASPADETQGIEYYIGQSDMMMYRIKKERKGTEMLSTV